MLGEWVFDILQWTAMLWGRRWQSYIGTEALSPQAVPTPFVPSSSSVWITLGVPDFLGMPVQSFISLSPE